MMRAVFPRSQVTPEERRPVPIYCQVSLRVTVPLAGAVNVRLLPASHLNTATATTSLVTAPPTAPTSLVASSSARRRIDLGWINTAADATSITVERCTGSTCTAFAAVAQLAGTATSWSDLAVRSRSTYRYRVSASSAAGTSPYSNIASATAR